MAGLGTLTLNLVTQIGQFIAPLEQAENAATDATDNIAEGFSLAGAAATAFGALLAGASVAGVYEYITGIMQAADELDAFAKLANSSVSQFQYFSKGAASAGIEMEQFADQMKDMQDRIGDFQQSGGGPLADFFENIAPLIGVTIQQFQKLSGPEAMQLFYDSLVKVGATKNDIKFYMEGIISDSSKLIPLLENGGAGFKRFGDNALAAGSIMSTDVVNGLSEANKNLMMMMEHWTGLKVALVENVAPAISFVVENFDEIKAVALALGAAIAARLVVQLGMLSVQFVQGVIQGVQYQMTLAAMAGETITLSAATATLKASMMSLVGGPAGIAILAIQAVAAGAAFMYMRKESDDLKPSLDSQNISVQELVNSYVRLDDAAKRTQVRAENAKLTELSRSYEDASSKLISLTVAMGRFDGSSDTAVKAANDLAMQYKQGDITAEQFAQKINGLNGVSEESKAKIDAQASAVGRAKSEMQKQQNVVDSLAAKNKQLSASHDQVASSVNLQAQAYLSLTQKQREALNTVKGDLERENYININMKAGWSREKAEYYADYRDQAGLGYTGKTLSDLEKKTVEQGYKLQLSTEAREESERKTAEYLKEQQKIREKMVNSKTIDSVIGKGEGGYNSVNLGKKFGYKSSTRNLTEMTIGQILAAQERKEFNTAGKYQLLGSTLRGAVDAGIASTAEKFTAEVQERILQNYLLTAKKGRGKIEDYIRGKTDDLFGANLDTAKEFAAIASPVTGKSYHDGSANNKARISVKEAQDALKASRELYAQAIASGKSAQEAWKSAFNGSISFVDGTELQKGLDSIVQANIKFEQDQEQFKEQFSSADVVRNQKRIDDIAEAERLGLQHLIPRIEERYANETRLSKLELDQQLNSWNWTEDEKLKKEAELNKAHIVLSSELNDIQKQLAKEAVDDQLAYDLQQFRKAQKWKEFEAINSFKAIQDQILGLGSNTDDIFAKATMTPGEYESWSLKNNRDSAKLDLRNNLTSVEQNIVQSDAFDSEDDRYQALIDAHKEYRDALAAIDVQYDQQVKDLAQSQHDMQMGIWQDLLTRTGTIFNDMAAMVKETAGESSAAYKAMFLVNQGISIAQAMINTEVAATKAMAEGGYVMGIPMATAIRGLGYASVGMIAAQTIAGMAHDGIDSVPKEGTWLLDRGERVVDSRTNADLKDYLAKGGGSGDVHISVQVTDSGVSTQSNQSNQKQLGQMIGNAVRSVIMQEKRQGGLLAR
ncbi:hypothetical protein [Acinetobacter sp. CFCC 10889]|uniref:hypothetical protein n=1 Tax=Acinetobacter sp. CFCC 10889 TaxID=1775557 RepID=UPI0013A69000|nr:hypothetical protein [Acinetobacter sp. CFCC 10889]